MSAAHRATYKPAIATSRAGGYQGTANIRHERDLPSHKQLKKRTDLTSPSIKQRGNQDDQIDSMKRTLEARESRTLQAIEHTNDQQSNDQPESEIPSLDADEDQKHSIDESSNHPIDQPINQSVDGSEDEDDDDEEEQIRRELEAIREERRIQREQQAAEEVAAALAANPLLANKANRSSGSKRKFDSGMIFKSTTSADVDEQTPKRFLNDAVRSDQHRAFMKSYIR